MTAVFLDDRIRQVLEANAAARGLSLADYLELVAKDDAAQRVTADASANSLADVLSKVLDTARRKPAEPRPSPADPFKAGFDETMFEKYRKQGFSL